MNKNDVIFYFINIFVWKMSQQNVFIFDRITDNNNCTVINRWLGLDVHIHKAFYFIMYLREKSWNLLKTFL